MRADNVGAPATQAQWNFIHHQGRNLRTSLELVANVFAPSCISHTVLTKPSWTAVTVDGVSLPDALQCWVEQDHPGERALVESPVPVAQPPVLGGHLQPVQADSPHTSFKRLNVDLIKSIDQYQSNSMGHRTKKMRHKPNIVHNRTNKRNNKNRRKRNKRRCQYGETLESKIRCAKEENEVRRRREKSGRSLGEVERSNRDLLRSIQRGGSMLREQKQRRRRRRKRQRRVSSEQRLSKEERRQLRRQERRRLKKEEKRRRQKQGSLSSRRQGRRLTSSTPVLSFAQLSAHFSREQQRRLSPRSIQSSRSGQCKARHVDVCSWPQCNRSCPKLHNPMTGETSP